MTPTLVRRMIAGGVLTTAGVAGLLAATLVPEGAGLRPLVVIAALMVALAGLLFLWLGLRGLTRSLREISAHVERLSREGVEARLDPADVGALQPVAESLNTLVDRLAARIEEVGRDRDRLRKILGSMEEGVVVADDDAIRFANPAAGRMLGTTPESLRTLTPTALRILAEQVMTSDAPAQREIETGLPVRTLLAAGIPLRDAGGVLLVLRDVTAVRRVEAMRRDFVADASHELKTPVAAIQVAAETLERALDEDPAAAVRFAGQLRHESARLSRMVSDLLDLSRLESERPVFEPVRLDLLAREEAGRLDGSARAAGVTMEIEARPVTVSGSPKDLALLVGNLLENAVHYTPGGGRVKVAVGPSDGRAVVSVEDTGIGIPSRDLPRIFERFYRVDRARSRATGGTGLGLSIARHVTEQHGGRIEAESELGRGTTFRVWLPARAEA